MKRKSGQLTPIEMSILVSAADLGNRGITEFHGYIIAKEVRARTESRFLTAFGTLYRALDRLEIAGLLKSKWEDPIAAAENKHLRRHIYQLTPAGETRARKKRVQELIPPNAKLAREPSS